MSRTEMNERIDFPKVEFEVVDDFWDKLKNTAELGEGTYGKVYRVLPKNGQIWDEEEKAFKLLKKRGDCVLEISHLSQLLGTHGLLPLNKVLCQGDEIGLLFPIGSNFEKWWKKRKEEQSSVLETMEDMLTIAKSLMVSLYEMHEKGIVHRDLSPDNIIFYDWTPHIIDLGYSRHQSVERDVMTSGYHLTIRQYRAPEILDPDFFEYTTDSSLFQNMKIRDSDDSSFDGGSDQEEEGSEDDDPKQVLKKNLRLIMDDTSHAEDETSSESGIDSNGSQSIDWKKIFPNQMTNKMEWIDQEAYGKKRVRYYTEKIDEWSLGTILYSLFFGEDLFHGNIYNQWFQHHCFYFNRYGTWLTDKHPDIFCKLTEENGTDQVNLGKKLNSWFKENKKTLSSEAERSQLSKYLSSFYLILYRLLDPNPNNRMSARQVLIEAFHPNCLPKNISNPQLPIRPTKYFDSPIPLSKIQAKHMLPLITHLYEFCNKEQPKATAYYHALNLWMQYAVDRGLTDLLEIKRFLVIAFDVASSYRNIAQETVFSFEKKIRKKQKLWKSKKHRNECWIDLMKHFEGSIWLSNHTNSLHCAEIEWEEAREYRVTNSVMFSVQEQLEFPSSQDMGALLAEDSDSSEQE